MHSSIATARGLNRSSYFVARSCHPKGGMIFAPLRSPLSGRYFSSARSYALRGLNDLPCGRSLANNPESLALQHVESGQPTTSLVISKILSNQNVVVTESKLNLLLKVKGVEFDLPISLSEKSILLAKLTGKSKYSGFFGVYMFIHKKTGDKYVGSSNLLRRRMNYYFKGNFVLGGKFLPLLDKEGLKAFKLRIFKLDSKKFSSQDALILEQYFLLNKEFNLNTLRVVNAGSSKGDSVYIYDLTCSTLYYKAKSKIDLKRVLKIHPETCKKFLDSKIPYLNKFLLLSYPLSSASIGNISMPLNKVGRGSLKGIEELLDFMQKKRREPYKLGTRRSIPVILEVKNGNTFVKHVNLAFPHRGFGTQPPVVPESPQQLC